MSTVELRLFFDESGKRSNRPNLMGGLSIPSIIYQSDRFVLWSQQLRDGTAKFHWVGYTGDSKVRENIIELMQLVSSYHKLLKFNIINYDYSMLTDSGASNTIISQIVYSKFPERLMYGLLRRYGRNIKIDADICIEEATEYKDIALHETIREQLNVQSMYRGEQFRVISSCLIPKGKEVGLELTDLLLGFVRTIVLNEPDAKSKTVQAKNELIIELLKDNRFYSFMENFRLFEWTRGRELNETSFSDYIQVFVSHHHDKFLK